ncbi:Generative cell specific 1 protein, putative [Leishmania guyanensis]
MYIVTPHSMVTKNAMLHHRVHSAQDGKSGVLPSSRLTSLATVCGCLALALALVALMPASKGGLVVMTLWACGMAHETVRTYLAAPPRCSLCRSPPLRRHAVVHGTVYVALLWVFLLVWLAQPARAAFASSSLISYCSDSGDEKINCKKKMVVTVTVEGGQLPDEESLLFLNSATDMTIKNGTAVQFSPIRITTSRSAVRYRYPLFYVQNYNTKPYEATVKGSLLNQCNADFDTNTATCGIAHDAAGKPILYSQGFCCDCSMCQTLGLCLPDARANAGCNIFDRYTTASCLRFTKRWYSGYTIGGYVTWYTVNLTLSRNVSVSGGAGSAEKVVTQKVVMHLSPSSNGETAGEEWDVMARVLGNYAPIVQPLDLTSRMLFAPAIPPNDERVQAGAAEWMLLPTNLVTLDGRECDKVGVSYEAFASQGNKCNLRPGSCLNSQLEDYRTTDLERIASGNKGQYMATSFGDFHLERDAVASPYISYRATSPAATMLSITISADDLEYTVGLASGKIVSAELNKPVLEASTKDGVMTVVVRNAASVTGRVVVGTSSCSDGVFPITAQTLSLAAQQQSTVAFNVYMQDSYASENASCMVVLRNAQEVITDLRTVSWKVSSTSFHNGTQGGSANPDGGTTEASSAASCSKCRTLDVACAVQRRCWQLTLLYLFVYLLLTAAVMCAIWLRHIFCCCFYFLNRQHRRHHPSGSSGVEPKDEASRLRSCSKGHDRSGAASSFRRTDRDNSDSVDAPPRTATPASSIPPPGPAMMYIPTSMYYAASPTGSFALPQHLPSPPSVLQPPTPMPPLGWCPYNNEGTAIPEEDLRAAQAFPPYSPSGSFVSVAPSVCSASRHGEEWGVRDNVESISPLTPSRSTQEGSPQNEGDNTPRAFRRSWASTLRQSPLPEVHAPYL